MHQLDFDLNVDQVSKIEGHAAIDLTVREGKVKDLRFKITDYKRFYTQAIRGKVIAAVPQLVARICGTCSNAHLLCAIKCIEKALSISPSEQTMILRKLLTYGLMIRDHALHLYLFSLPDVLGKDSIFDFDENDPKEHDLLHDAFAVKSAGNALAIWSGGRSVHAPFPMVGGYLKFPEEKGKADVLSKLKEIRNRVLRLIDVFRACDFHVEEDFVSAALDSGDYSFIEGDIIHSDGTRIPQSEFGTHLEHVVIPYSQASAYTYDGKLLLVGALARLNLFKNRLHSKTQKDTKETLSVFPSKNIFHNNVAQAIEILHSIDSAVDLIENTQFTPEKPMTIVPNESEASVAIEAPRGILFYHLKLATDGKVMGGRIVVPTGQNHIAIERSVGDFIADKLDKPKEQLSIDMEKVVRAFDPCMSCAVHFLKVNWI